MIEMKDGGPAFPVSVSEEKTLPSGQGYGPVITTTYFGMTLRDYFAGQALAGLLAANATYGGKTDARDALASDAYQTADAMLKAREVQP